MRSPLIPVRLRCEFLSNPTAIPEASPRLGWELRTRTARPRRGLRQTAYRVLAASKPERLEPGAADLWDSGRVSSPASWPVLYGGKTPASGQTCWWKVRVWDDQGRASAWSEAAHWTVALRRPDDWQAEWIEWDTVSAEQRAQPRFDGLTWVGAPAAPDSGQGTPICLARTVTLPENRTVRRAQALLAATGPFELWINGRRTEVRSSRETPVRRDVQAYLQPGPNRLAIEVRPSPGSPAAVLGRVLVEFDQGPLLDLAVDLRWKIHCKPAAELARAPGDAPEPGSPARGFGMCGTPPWRLPGAGAFLLLPPARFLRKTFDIEEPPERAMLYFSALGVCDVYLNGKRVCPDVLAPGWTDYRRRVPYRAYDVSGLLHRGRNAIAAVLADGWYAGYVGWGCIRERYGPVPRFLAQLELHSPGEPVRRIVTDGSWKAHTAPTLEADLLMGETYDARREIPGWNSPAFEDGDWAPVRVRSRADGPLLYPHPAPPVRPTQELSPQNLHVTGAGTYVFDLAQNMVGWVRITVTGPRGARVRLRFGEVLNPDGTVYTMNLRGARALDTYVLAGRGREVWEPRFTFHGFRYVEILEWPGDAPPPTLDSVTGIVIHSDLPLTAWFECSNPMVNQLFRNILWTQRGNYLEVPTDCPQRDERLGWTGDAQAFLPAACFLMDAAPFFKKWLVDLEDGRNPEGVYPHVAPDVGAGFGSPVWSDAGVLCPWTLHRMFADEQAIRSHYPAMKRYVDFLARNSDGLIRPAQGYGDWLSMEADTPKDLVATAYFAGVAKLMEEMAQLQGLDQDAAAYRLLFESIRRAFARRFLQPDGRTHADTQTSYVLALGMDLLNPGQRETALRRLVEDIEARDDHLSCGFVGTALLMPVLSRAGRTDVAYRLLLQDTCPSWLYPVRLGATTIWERWDGIREDGSFQTPAMNSFNHYAFGSVARWLFETVLGIQPAQPGFAEVRIAPEPGGGLTYARGAYHSIRGPIRVEWSRTQAENHGASCFRLRITLPPGMEGTVRLPAGAAAAVTESGTPLHQADGVSSIRETARAVECHLVSCHYRFEMPDPEPAHC